MTSGLFNVAFDCADPYHLAQFWSKVTGQPLGGEESPGDPEVAFALSSGINLYFQRVPESKVGKNRVHVCLRPLGPAGSQADELRRLLAIGATIVDDRRELKEHGGWVVLGDPEGNEFCLLRTPMPG
jgi:predicted enzyme related to lactoylglutathione lyase